MKETGIIKYILPVSERVVALENLDRYNINAFSLFGTEESLLETMFLRNFIFQKNTEETLRLVESNKPK